MLQDLGLSLDRVILVEVSDSEIKKRLSGRAQLERRSDDGDGVIAHRLEVYRRQTEPLVAYYEAEGLLDRVNGELSIDEVFAAMEKLAAAQTASRNG
jgi:adenylate kinase